MPRCWWMRPRRVSPSKVRICRANRVNPATKTTIHYLLTLCCLHLHHKFPFAVLRLIRDWQQQHGIRFGDYQRYRGYCTRRIARLRKVLKLPQADKRHFKKRDVTTAHLSGAKADIRYLHVPLMMAERSWAFAMALRQESNTEPRKRFHLISKLRKGCAYALQLQELCSVSSEAL